MAHRGLPMLGGELFGIACRTTHTLSASRLARSSLSYRALHNTRPRLALFSRSTPPPPTPPSPPSSSSASTSQSSEDDNLADIPLTPFQERIASLESAAIQSPESLPNQLALLRALLEGGEFSGLCRYYEATALSEDAESRSKALLGSEEGWGIFLEALGKAGRLAEAAKFVRRRDALLGVSSSSTSTSASSPSPTPTTTATSAATPTPAPQLNVSPLVASLSKSTTTPADTAASSAGASQPGTPLSPIHVQLAPPPASANAWRGVRYIIGVLLWGFLLLTVVSMMMESTGLMKAGPGPQEFAPEEGKRVRFSDVHGCDEAKSELEEIVEFLKNPEKFSNLGGRLPKGVLLTGPPGTGKTLLAKAIAGEAEVPFFFASGSGFDEMFVGVGAKRIRELFAAAKKKAPAIVFIDELDALGSKRGARDLSYMKQTLNQLLVELDGFEGSEGVIIVAATNFPQSLDPALTRPGRFDRHVNVGLPDVRGRVAILKYHMSNVQYDTDVDPTVIARGTPGMSGADLQNLVNQAAVKASREGSTSVQLKHFEWAKGKPQIPGISADGADRILMGAERRSHYVTDESKRATAYHEGGHALVALHTPGAMPLHKVTIMPRGQALGITFQLPEQDKDSYTRREYNAMIDVALGGRAAEEMIFGRDDTTSGCSSDLSRATDVAARMIRSYGFSDKVGLVALGDEESQFLSGKQKDVIEGEVRA
ncbi:P-loop containing nucleoside triphosphate hydrolase protein [Naematelia encephala]|uniref:p-loop containing nucleoside triphosphate hydrolase protein n=1 Tax=Naematelia encephala TaxID=71784 RepID=A0A1Y2B001_9TREE|nr:P-loop containing nucleoside triphosphate hydrolase protein [Naematelia encephala]